MSGIPPVVPRSLRLEVDRLQEQLKVLVNNLAILNNQAACQPHNTTINYQINKVKEYIVYYNDQQLAILHKIRQFLADLEAGHFVKRALPSESEYYEDDRRRKGGSWSLTPSRSSSTVSDQEDEEDEEQEEEGENGGADDGSGEDEQMEENDIFLEYLSDTSLYKGHVDEYKPEMERILTLESSNCSPIKKLKRDEVELTTTDEANYMAHLDLLPINIAKEYVDLLAAQQEKKKYREFLDVPEVSDKKYRNQSFLMKLTVSPPKLRARKEKPDRRMPRPVRAITFPPERMGTRKQNSMKVRRRLEEDEEFEKLRKSEPDFDE